jgi:hypothetical protein
MKKLLGRATAVAAGALMMVGLGATAASAHVAAGGAGGYQASAEEPMGAIWGIDFAKAGEITAVNAHADWATDETGGGVDGGGAEL